MSRWSRLAPWIAGALCAAVSLFFGFNQPINDDDIFHLHSLWLVGDGLVPYRDFLESHPPGLWAIFAPLVGLFETPSTLEDRLRPHRPQIPHDILDISGRLASP